MPNPYFRFKQFTVYHDKCAMKVGTDGVLLGAWASLIDAKLALDIGCGSGLISLMLAQRGNDCLKIDSIDIDADAVTQSNENFAKSQFSHIASQNISLQEFVFGTTQKYDCIVSNPPFFVSSLKSPKEQRTLARHTDSLPIEDLVICSKKLLSDNGKLSFIYPHIEKDYLLALAERHQLFVSRITNVYPTPTSVPKRVLMELSVKEELLLENNLIIEQARHIYTDDFTLLVKEFYLEKG